MLCTKVSAIVVWLTICTVTSENVNKLEGQHLDVITVHLPPMMIITGSMNGRQYSGPVFHHLDWLSKRLHFSYTLRQEENNIIGAKVNGSWNGMMGQMQNQKAHLCAYPFLVSLERSDAVEHAGFVSGDENVLLAQYPTTQVSWTAVCQPYSLESWLTWLASFVVINAVCLLLVVLGFKRITDGRSRIKIMDDMAVYILTVVTCQGGYYKGKVRYLSVIAASWCFVAFVFVNVYNSTLTSTLAISYKAPEINSVQQLADSTKFQLVTIKGILPDMQIMAATSGPLQKIGDKVRDCSPCRIPPEKMSDVEGKVLHGNYIGIAPSTAATSIIQANHRRTKECQLTLAQQRYGWRAVYLGLPKSSPYIEEINRESLWAHAFGLPFYWKSYPKDFGRCTLRYNKQGFEVQSSNQPLKLTTFYLPLCLLIFGYLLSAMAFIYERTNIRHN